MPIFQLGKQKTSEMERDPLIRLVERGSVPSPGLVENYFDPEIFYTAAAFMYGSYMRIGHPSFTHAVRAALKPNLRLKDMAFPSGYTLYRGEQHDELFHEFFEVVEDLIGVYIMSEFVRGYFPERAYSVDLMSNYEDIAKKPVESILATEVSRIENDFGEKIKTEEGRQELYDECSKPTLVVLKNTIGQIDYSKDSIEERANHIIKGSEDESRGPIPYLEFVRKSELPPKEKQIISDIVVDKVRKFEDCVKDVKPRSLEEFVVGVYDKISGFVRNRDYIGADHELVAGNEPLFTATLDKTIYHRYLGRMKNAALDKFRSKVPYEGDEHLSIVIEKLTDLATVVALFEVSNMVHMLHQQRNASRGLHILGAEIIGELRELGVEEVVYDERLKPANLYLLRMLENRVRATLEWARKGSRIDRTYSKFVGPLEYMVSKKIPDLKRLLRIKRTRWGLGAMNICL